MRLLIEKTRKRVSRARKGTGSLRVKKGMFYYRINKIERACYTSDRGDAEEVLKRALAGIPPTPPSHRANTSIVKPDAVASGITVGELLDEYLAKQQKKAEYREQGDTDYDADKALSGVRGVVRKLRAKLGHIEAEKLSSADTREYRTLRETEGVIFSTVNHELRYLHAALNDAKRNEKLTCIPAIWLPSEESRVREGFLERPQYLRIFHALPDSLKALFVCGFHTGARAGELKKINWAMVDFNRQIIQLRPKTTKNKAGRYIPIWGDMREVLQWQKTVRDRECPECEAVFFWHMNSTGGTVSGSRLGRHDRVFKNVTTALGIPLIFHDLRRSAIKYANQEADIEAGTVKLMSGHKTDSVFRRYNIAEQREIVKMGTKLDKYLAESGGSIGLHLKTA
jgi:integrase